MNIAIPLNLSTQHLEPFRAAWKQASTDVAALTADMLERCRHVDLNSVPASLQPHIGQVGALVNLLDDPGWLIDTATRSDLAGALIYFDQIDDLIPDSEPAFGLLDDAIVIELALAEHREVWAAWSDYRRVCVQHRELAPISSRQWLDLRGASAMREPREHSYVELRYARSGQRSRYLKLDALPRLDLS